MKMIDFTTIKKDLKNESRNLELIIILESS